MKWRLCPDSRVELSLAPWTVHGLCHLPSNHCYKWIHFKWNKMHESHKTQFTVRNHTWADLMGLKELNVVPRFLRKISTKTISAEKFVQLKRFFKNEQLYCQVASFHPTNIQQNGWALNESSFERKLTWNNEVTFLGKFGRWVLDSGVHVIQWLVWVWPWA